MPTTRSQAKRKEISSTASSHHRNRITLPAEPLQNVEVMSQATWNDRVAKVSDLLSLFSSEAAQSQASMDTGADNPLNLVRHGISNEIYVLVAQATANDESLFEQLREIWFIETSRREVLQLLQECGHGSGSEASDAVIENCATGLQSIALRLGGQLSRRPTTTRFAAGVLIMILEEVVNRAAPGHSLYGRLIGSPQSADEELCVVRCLAVGEDVLEPYIRQMQSILTKFEQLERGLQPRSDMVQRLREKVQPTYNRSAIG